MKHPCISCEHLTPSRYCNRIHQFIVIQGFGDVGPPILVCFAWEGVKVKPQPRFDELFEMKI